MQTHFDASLKLIEYENSQLHLHIDNTFILVCCNKNNGATSFERITLKTNMSTYLNI